MATVGKRILKTLGWIAGTVLGVLLILIVYINARWDVTDGRPAPALNAPTDSATIAHGEYIFKYQVQCWGCHQAQPSGPGAPPSGGMLFDLTDVGPGFGKWYSRNLTPDVETGIGGWTDGEIVQALREGIRKDRTPLFPIMPIDWYHGMADEDILSVVAYLRTLEPVRNPVPVREPSFMAKALMAFGVIGPKDRITAPVVAPTRGVTPEYGRYIASNRADCADCHTPRNLQDGQFYMDSLFAGGTIKFGEPEGDNIYSYARNITPDVETGIGAWTEEQFLDAVTSGVRPDGTVLMPHMPYAYYKFWTQEDLRAVYAYLKTVPSFKRKTPAPEYSPLVHAAQGAERGDLLFQTRCQTCHGKNGSGAEATNVKLAEVAASLSDADLKEFIATGQMSLKMPPFGKTLTEKDLNDVVAFIRTWEKKPD